jgi:hypothetical protein
MREERLGDDDRPADERLAYEHLPAVKAAGLEPAAVREAAVRKAAPPAAATATSAATGKRVARPYRQQDERKHCRQPLHDQSPPHR